MTGVTLRSLLLLALLSPLFPTGLIAQEGPQGEMVLTVLFDNLTEDDHLGTGWGFAALLETPSHTVLFDAGADGEILMENMRLLGKDPAKIEAIVISHAHGDHTGGMAALLATGIRPSLYVLQAFPSEALEAFSGGLEPIFASPGQEIVPGIRTTGVVGEGALPEQALILQTREGSFVLTGCAHPGPSTMVRRAVEVTGQPMFGLLGGLHLFQTPPEEVQGIIAGLKAQGIVKAGATHCTGPEAMAAFQESFGEDYIPLGVGRVLRFVLP